MASPSERLAESLEILHGLQNANGAAAIRARDMTQGSTGSGYWPTGSSRRSSRAGTYRPARRNEGRQHGLFGKSWSLSREQSLTLHGGNWTVPRQLAVRSPKGKNNVTMLPHGTSPLDLKAAPPAPAERQEKDGLRLYERTAA